MRKIGLFLTVAFMLFSCENKGSSSSSTVADIVEIEFTKMVSWNL